MNSRPHPLRGDFRWQPPPPSPRMLSVDQVDAYDRDGFFVLEDVFDSDTLAPIVDEIDGYEAEATRWLREQPGGKVFIARADEITFTTHLVKRSAQLRAFCSCAPLRDIAHDLIGPDVRLYWDQGVYKKPGTQAPFPWHQDNGYTFIEPQQYLTCWIALTDADTDNGCPHVVPGVHRSGTLAHELTDLGYRCFEDEPEDAVAAPVRAGGIVVFSSLTPHATGPNLTDSVRKAYIVQFAPDGAVAVSLDGGGQRIELPVDDPERQFPILVGGRAASAG